MAQREYETLYRWQWFQRAQWLPSFRHWKRNSPLAFKTLLNDTEGRLALDASCGLGLKTIVMQELGLDVVGSDGCTYAVERARKLATSEGLDIEFFVSGWAELPERTEQRFDGVFNDALSWIPARDEFEAALRGFNAVLKPGGVFMFMGAGEDSPADPESRRQLFEDHWASKPKFSVEWSHEEGGTRCTSILVRERGDMYVDAHHVFLVEEDGRMRIETATIREPVFWHWESLQDMFGRAGFSKLETRSFEGTAEGGGQLTFDLNVATK